MAESGGTFWAAGFWADGFWADGFWAGGVAPPPTPAPTAAGGGAPKKKRREKRVWKLHDLQNATSLAELHDALAMHRRGETAEVAAVADTVVALDEPDADEIALIATIAEFALEDD